jgi:hypothetical protein
MDVIFSETEKKTAGRSTTSPRACNQTQTIQFYKITSIYLGGGVMGNWGAWGNIPSRIYLFGFSESTKELSPSAIFAVKSDDSTRRVACSAVSGEAVPSAADGGPPPDVW